MDTDFTVVGLHNPAGHRESQAGPPRAARPVGTEDCFQSFLLDPGAIVPDLNLDEPILGGQGQSEIAAFFALQHLDGVQHQIQERLFEQ